MDKLVDVSYSVELNWSEVNLLCDIVIA
jgi:hypothetical protein